MNRTQALAVFEASKEAIDKALLSDSEKAPMNLSELKEAIGYAIAALTTGPRLANWKINPPFIEETYRCTSCGYYTSNSSYWCPNCDSLMSGVEFRRVR